MNRRFILWQEWRKAYWKSMDRYPELFAFLHRMYVFHYNLENAVDKKDEVLFKVPGNERFRALLKKIRRIPEKSTHAHKLAANMGKALPSSSFIRSDILFYTHSHRDTCLGVGEKIFQKIRHQEIPLTGSYYQNIRHVILDEEVHEGIPVLTLNPRVSLRSLMRFSMIVPIVYLNGMKSLEVATFILKHPLITMVNLLKITITADCINTMLCQVAPKVIISPNEQGGADASIMFALARKVGIHTIQYLHCPPTKQFVPFISNEYWTWSPLTRDMMLGSDDDERVRVLGALEHEATEDCITGATPRQCDEEVRILYLAQMAMDDAWGIKAVSKGSRILREGIQLYPKQLKLRIREHPYADKRERAMLESQMNGMEYEITTKATPLTEDIEWATHVYSVSSTAIIAALIQGKPGFLFWNEELNSIYGQAFLPPGNIVSSGEELIDSLRRPRDMAAIQQVIHQVLGPPGAVDRAVSRIEQIIGAC
jgi:hypothetical protein